MSSNLTNQFGIEANTFCKEQEKDLQTIQIMDLMNDIDAYFHLIDDPQLTTTCVLHIKEKITRNAITNRDIIISRKANLIHNS